MNAYTVPSMITRPGVSPDLGQDSGESAPVSCRMRRLAQERSGEPPAIARMLGPPMLPALGAFNEQPSLAVA